MARLIYSSIASLDGHIADENGMFDWAFPGEEVHAFINELTRPIGTFLYGRSMYEVMAPWETMHEQPNQTPVALEFAAIWQAAEKVVYSTTLDDVTTSKTRLERRFDPEAVRAMKASAERDLAIAGPTLARHAFAAGLVDELQLFVVPIIVGSGTASLPEGVRVPLTLLEERRFDNGFVYLRYESTS
jgi:dihydrofolate reductase